MNEHLQRILRCPITRDGLREMSMDEIEEANSRISKGELIHYGGTLVRRNIRSAFISLNGQFAYPVEGGIIILLESLAIVLNKDAADGNREDCLRKEKQDVRDFYDQIGWHKGEGGQFVDALKFEDLRPVSKDYIHKCHLRVNRHLKPSGKYLVDAASGPVQYPEYLSYSSGYDFRICVDISFVALKEARRKLGDRGIYLLADVTNLPLQDNLADAVVSLHTVYHVPKNEQGQAFREIYRVLKPGSSAVVVYSWKGHSFFMDVMFLPHRISRRFKALIRSTLRQERSLPANKSSGPSGPKLYSHAYDYKWFVRQKSGFEFDILVWRSVSVPFLKTYIHNKLFGKQRDGSIIG